MSLSPGSAINFSISAISTGTKGYVTFQGKPYSVPPDVFAQFKQGFERQQRQDKQRSNLDLTALGINPETSTEADWQKKREAGGNSGASPGMRAEAGGMREMD